MKKILLSALIVPAFLISISAYAQTPIKQSNVCGKKWYLEKIKDAEGVITKRDKSSAKDYVLYKCDGSYEDIDLVRTTTGQWTLDEATGIVTVNQDQGNAFTTHITRADGAHLTIEEKDANGATTTLMFKTK